MTTSPAQASALPTRRPGTHRAPRAPRPAPPPGYDLDRAWQLLADTSELPATQRGLLKIFTQYRHALHALATELQAIQQTQRATSPGELAQPSPDPKGCPS